MDDHGRTSREDLFAQITERWAVPVTSEALLQHYQSEFPRTFTVADDVVNALRTLRSSHVAVGVVTNGPPTQRTKLEVSGLIDEVDVVCVSGEVGAHKPDRAIFDLALKSLGSPSAAWMVGDSPEADVAGAHAAGIPAAWVSRGRNWPAAQRPPEMTVGSVVEFADWALGAAD
jgi:putative hydrolase of the HAD superfamily